MEALDNFLIDRIFQPIADWLNDMFGLSHALVAWYCMHISIVCGMADMYTKGITPVRIGVMALICVTGYTIMLRFKKDADTLENSRTPHMNVRRITERHVRLLIVIMLPLGLRGVLFETLDAIFYTSAIFFIACEHRNGTRNWNLAPKSMGA